MIRILQTEAAALALTQEIELLEGIPRPGTTTWGAPVKHATEDRWAVILSDLSQPLAGDLPTYPAGWFPDVPT